MPPRTSSIGSVRTDAEHGPHEIFAVWDRADNIPARRGLRFAELAHGTYVFQRIFGHCTSHMSAAPICGITSRTFAAAYKRTYMFANIWPEPEKPDWCRRPNGRIICCP
jgi:hypothetical protein